jgi:hypothetical protein
VAKRDGAAAAAGPGAQPLLLRRISTLTTRPTLRVCRRRLATAVGASTLRRCAVHLLMQATRLIGCMGEGQRALHDGDGVARCCMCAAEDDGAAADADTRQRAEQTAAAGVSGWLRAGLQVKSLHSTPACSKMVKGGGGGAGDDCARPA